MENGPAGRIVMMATGPSAVLAVNAGDFISSMLIARGTM